MAVFGAEREREVLVQGAVVLLVEQNSTAYCDGVVVCSDVPAGQAAASSLLHREVFHVAVDHDGFLVDRALSNLQEVAAGAEYIDFREALPRDPLGYIQLASFCCVNCHDPVIG